MRNSFLFAAAASCAVLSAPATAQTTTGERIGQILGSILGVGNSADASLDGQWRAGRTPLGNQRTEFMAKVDTDTRSGKLSAATSTRLKSDYDALVKLEADYAADRVFTTAEKTDLTTRYNTLVQVLNDGRYADGYSYTTTEVANGQAEFNRRVDAQVTARKLTRTGGTRLKADYAALVTLETRYLSDGVLSASESADLDARLDALDARVGDVAYTVPVTAESRLDAIFRALPSAGLSATARAQLLVEHGDLTRLAAAYARAMPTAEEKAYLEQRLANLETRAKVAR